MKKFHYFKMSRPNTQMSAGALSRIEVEADM